MLKALILGLAISCLLLGIECLAVEQIKLPQGDSRIVIIPEVFGWLLIGIGSSTTLYTLIHRSSSLVNSSSDVDTTDYDLTEHYHDDEETDDAYEEYDAYDEDDDTDDATDDEDYFETDEEDESEPEFDLEKFNQQFDIDELLDE